MEVNFEYINPFDEQYDYMMRIEHLGRYYFASERLKNFKKVLDVACADGYGTKILSQRVANVDGIDRNEEYLRVARTKYNSNNINYKCIDVDKKTITDTYDGIVCFETLEHVIYPEKLLKKIYNSLNEGGLLLISVPNDKFEIIIDGKNKDTYHLHIFSYNDLIKLFEKCNFKIIKCLGQSTTNKIVNKEIKEPVLKKEKLKDNCMKLAYPNEIDINDSYSYIFILKKVN